MTEEKLDLLLDLAMEQYDPKPGKKEKLERKLLRKQNFFTSEQRQIAQVFQLTFETYDKIMQMI